MELEELLTLNWDSCMSDIELVDLKHFLTSCLHRAFAQGFFMGCRGK